MHEILSTLFDDVVVKTVLLACAARGAVHLLILFSRISLFLMREMRDEILVLRHEIEEWRKFFRGP